MMDFMDTLSYRQLALMSFLLASVAFIPVGIRLVEKPTDIRNHAAPASNPIASVKNPTGMTKITGMKPCFGKPGDEIVIWGENMGIYPQNYSISIHETKAETIRSWTEQEIIFTIPENAVSGPVRITIAGSTWSLPMPLTIVHDLTGTILSANGNGLDIRNAPPALYSLNFWLDSGGIRTINLGTRNSLRKPVIHTDLPSDTACITLKDKDDSVLPYYMIP